MSPHDSSSDDEQLVRYLLGLLTDEEAERLDELSIANDEFAWRLHAVEDDLVDGYVSGSLGGDVREQFERSYLASDRRREKVRVAEALLRVGRAPTAPGGRTGASISVRTPLASDAPPRTRAWRVSRDRFVTRSSRWGLAAAALLLLGASALLLVNGSRLQRRLDEARVDRAALERRVQELEQQLREQQSASAGAASALERIRGELARATKPAEPPGGNTGVMATAVLLYPQTRAAGDVPMVSLTPGIESVAVDLFLESPDFSQFQAALRNPATGATIWRSGQVAPSVASASRVVRIVVPARVLKAQHYSVDLSGVGAGDPELLGSYVFRVVRR
jgi:hypothetical protein